MSRESVVTAIHAEGRVKMEPGDRKAVETQLGQLKDQLRPTADGDGQNRPERLQAMAKIQAEIRRLERVLEQDDDLIAKGGERAKLDARRKELEAIIKKEMPTFRQQQLKHSVDPQGYNKAVEQTVYHQRKYGAIMQEWQEIMRRLEPNDPEACNISRLIS